MKKVKMNNKNLVEYLIGKLVVLLLESLFGVGLVLSFFWCLGMLEQFMLTHTWAIVVIAIVGIASVFKMVSETE